MTAIVALNPDGPRWVEWVSSAFRRLLSDVLPDPMSDRPSLSHFEHEFLRVCFPVTAASERQDVLRRIDIALIRFGEIVQGAPPPKPEDIDRTLAGSEHLIEEDAFNEKFGAAIGPKIRHIVADFTWLLRAAVEIATETDPVRSTRARRLLNAHPWSLHAGEDIPLEELDLILSGFRGVIALLALVGGLAYDARLAPWLNLELASVAERGIHDYLRLLSSLSFGAVPAEVVPLSERLDLNAVEQEAREANDRIDRELLEQIRTGNVGLSA